MGVFYFHGNMWYTDTNSRYYPDIGIPENLTVEDYEVFQVVKQ